MGKGTPQPAALENAILLLETKAEIHFPKLISIANNVAEHEDLPIRKLKLKYNVLLGGLTDLMKDELDLQTAVDVVRGNYKFRKDMADNGTLPL